MQRTRTADQLQRLLGQLTPGTAKKDITTGRARTILAGVRPRDLVGETRRRLAAELVAIVKKMKALTKERKENLEASGSGLMDHQESGRSSRTGPGLRPT